MVCVCVGGVSVCPAVRAIFVYDAFESRNLQKKAPARRSNLGSWLQDLWCYCGKHII